MIDLYAIEQIYENKYIVHSISITWVHLWALEYIPQVRSCRNTCPVIIIPPIMKLWIKSMAIFFSLLVTYKKKEEMVLSTLFFLTVPIFYIF